MKYNKIQTTRSAEAPGLQLAQPPLPDSSLERMLRHGVKALSSCDLVALVLGPGGPISAAAMAGYLLSCYGSISDLVRVRPQVLQQLFGMGWARAGRLLAAKELGARLSAQPQRLGLKVRRPDDLEPMLADEFRGCDREHFLAVYLDTRHRVVSVETVSIGSLNASLVHPREVFKPAIAMGIAAVIVAHNHPSGCARPSNDDIELTARLVRCGELLGIELLDHIIVGRKEIVSLREHGWPDPDGSEARSGIGFEG